MEAIFKCYREIIPEFDRFQESLHKPLPNQIRVNTLRKVFVLDMCAALGASDPN